MFSSGRDFGQPTMIDTTSLAERRPLVASKARSRRSLKAAAVSALVAGAVLLGVRATAPAPRDAATTAALEAGSTAWTPAARCDKYSSFQETGCEMCGWAEPPTYFDRVAAAYPTAARACADSANASATNPLPAGRPLPGSAHQHGPSNAWYKACLWEALAALPEVCAGTFKPTAPPPVPAAKTPEDYTCDCELHAYCYSACGPEGGDNPYCAAYFAQHPHMDYFDWTAVTRPQPSIVGNVGPERLWDEEAFWCDATTLAAVEDGTFKPEPDLYLPEDKAFLAGVDAADAGPGKWSI